MPPSERWAPKLGAVVRFRTRPERPADEASPPLGNWKLISRNDRGPTHWWALAIDGDARAWAAANPSHILSGCIDAPGEELTPVNGVRF